MSDRKFRAEPWGPDDDEADDLSFKRLTREEAQALRANNPSVSPWRVIGAQAAIGLVVAMLAGLISARVAVVWSALYGAATVVVPGALMARGMTSRLSSLSPGVSFASVMLWSSVKIFVSVAMLALAPKVVQSLSWPALLGNLVVCMAIYWFALLRRGRKTS